MAANLDRAESALTAVSDIAYIRGIDSSGNSVRISKADLASVLGVKKLVSIPENKDLDEYIDGVFLLYQTQSSIIQTLIHKPSEVVYGEIQMFVFTVLKYGIQILFHSSANKMYIRYSHYNGFSEWSVLN